MSRTPVIPAALLAALLGTGCASTKEHVEVLPFHLAVLRPSVTEISPPRGEEPPSDGEDLELRMSPSRLADDILHSLEQRFSEVTLLDEEAGAGPEAWVSASVRAGADLLLVTRLAYDPHVTTSTNEKFWPNLSLFVLGGPGCYFVNDRDYFAACRLSGTFHDVAALASGKATPDDRRSSVLEVESELSRASLDFLDRAGGRPLPYLTSLFVPAGLLVRRGGSVEASLAEEIARELTADLADKVADGAERLLRAEPVRGFYLELPVDVRVDGGSASLRGTVLVHRDVQPRMDAYEVRCGGNVVRGAFVAPLAGPAGSPDRGDLRYRLDVSVPVSAGQEDLELELVAGGREPEARTYTLRLPQPTDASPSLVLKDGEPGGRE
jgi:hypothetical protein